MKDTILYVLAAVGALHLLGWGLVVVAICALRRDWKAAEEIAKAYREQRKERRPFSA